MQFGKSIRSQWLLEDNCVFLNHGSFGATPKVVLEAQTQWQQRLEKQPVRFMTQELPEALRHAAAELATFVGAKGEDIVFVENATAGINAVVRSLSFQTGDEIVITNHVYGAVRKTLQFICQRTGAKLIEVGVPFPISSELEITNAIAAALSPQVKLLAIDHVTSPTALIFPVAAIIRLAKQHGVPVLVDGAHMPGMMPLNIEALGADWYVGNCHKWLFAPKGCGFLWTSPAWQAEMHPTVISHGFGEGYLAEFDWTGTRDFSAWLAITEAIAFARNLGVTRIYEHNHSLAVWAGQVLNHAWGGHTPITASAIGAMTAVQVPTKKAQSGAKALHDYLWEKHRIEVPVIDFANRVWVRISAQVYNEPSEYRLLAEALWL
ncbi:aminotransferase class V-fold PLP-dependent enzyme [Pseudanabaena sp. PCC 6802]|uniref:aminotransferase class V-fold PLP-dependent enzyme n=1 Tax=Pseudanabaena sp. PCC 6802 TaxID=118173 RepID=UPI00034C3371|nr:aminotransferase class V-fold PLP-dependent enzyme [Pseudanabaena sp. PCC 6802]